MVDITQKIAPNALKLGQVEVPTDVDRNLAQKGLYNLEQYLEASAGRSRFPGKLRLVRPPAAQGGQPSDQGVVMKREMWWRKGNTAVRNDTSQYVRNLFKTAYIGKVHPQDAVQRALEQDVVVARDHADLCLFWLWLCWW